MHVREFSETRKNFAWNDPGEVIDPQADPSSAPEEAVESRVAVDEHSTLGLVELLLKDPARVDRLNRDESRQGELIPRFLGVALASFTLFGIAMVTLLNLAPAEAYPKSLIAAPPASVGNYTALALLVAYTVGLIAASGVCLPSFYFYGLLSGVKLSMLGVTSEAMKGAAATAIMLVGILPIYVAILLGMVVFGVPADILEFWLTVGLVLPFLAGLWGVRSIYRGMMGLADTLPPERRCRRECFLRRLTLSWAAVYTAVSPVMIYRLWEYFAGMIADFRVA